MLDYDNTSGEVNIFNDVSALIIIEQSCGEINYTINLAENAKLTLVFIGLKACKINFSINQASTSDVTVFQLLLDANAVVTGVTVNLNAPAAIFKINGLQLSKEKQILSKSLYAEIRYKIKGEK